MGGSAGRRQPVTVLVANLKDIYAEKPLCINWAECDQVVRAVQGSKVIFQVGFQRRADPKFLATIGPTPRHVAYMTITMAGIGICTDRRRN